MSLDRLQNLAERLESLSNSGSGHVLPAAHVFRRDTPSDLEATIYNPVICLILQGRKETYIGDQRASLAPGDALLVSHDLPVTSRITQASPEKPYRALILSLDLGMLRGLYEQVGEAVTDAYGARSLSTNTADPAWIGPI